MGNTPGDHYKMPNVDGFLIWLSTVEMVGEQNSGVDTAMHRLRNEFLESMSHKRQVVQVAQRKSCSRLPEHWGRVWFNCNCMHLTAPHFCL